MNNTEKILRAFIEASGFEVEEIRRKSGSTVTQGMFGPYEVDNYTYD